MTNRDVHGDSFVLKLLDMKDPIKLKHETCHTNLGLRLSSHVALPCPTDEVYVDRNRSWMQSPYLCLTYFMYSSLSCSGSSVALPSLLPSILSLTDTEYLNNRGWLTKDSLWDLISLQILPEAGMTSGWIEKTWSTFPLRLVVRSQDVFSNSRSWHSWVVEINNLLLGSTRKIRVTWLSGASGQADKPSIYTQP